MAFNWQTFKTRTLTAAVFIIIMLGGLLWNRWSFFILFSIIHFGCWYEYQKLVEKINPAYQNISPFHKYGVMLAGWCIMLYFTNDAYYFLGIRLHELGWWLGLVLLFTLPLIELLFAKQIKRKIIGYSFFGIIYISLSLGLMMDLYAWVEKNYLSKDVFYPGFFKPFSFYPVLFPAIIIFSLWINDTMAYIAGSLIGKTPFSKISPKKTWEGTIGGIILSNLAIGFIFSNIQTDIAVPSFHFSFATYTWFVIPAIAVITGTMGDLLESKLKRLAGVKDSGLIMPGHGGFLDRFDSLLVATPFVWLFVYFFL
ncbi:MAG: phosphatidate cytidylyltransferase [Chitinophagaceae bacterium]